MKHLDREGHEAGSKEVGSKWTCINFEKRLSDPVMFSQITSDVSETPMVTRMKHLDREGFQFKLQAEEAASEARTEQVSWFAMNKQTEGKRFIATTDNEVTHEPYEVSFESDNEGNPSFFAAMQTYNGGNTATLRNTEISENSAKVMVEEEKSKD